MKQTYLEPEFRFIDMRLEASFLASLEGSGFDPLAENEYDVEW